MKRLISLTLASLFLFTIFSTTSPAQSASPEALVDDFVKAWNSHERSAFERLFTKDAIQVQSAERLFEGRDNIVNDFVVAHTHVHKNSSLSLSGKVIMRTLRPDVAVLHFHLQLLENGQLVPGVDRVPMIVAVKEADGWRIAAFQLLKESPKRKDVPQPPTKP